MRKVVVYELSSLDGVADAPDRVLEEWDDAMGAFLAAVIATQDTVILGRRSYDEWAAFWPTSTIQPFSAFINSVEKYVVTSGALSLPWARSSVIDGDLVDFVRDLKAREGGDIGVHASISVARTLLRAGVVDELRLVVAPWIAGTGRRLFDGIPSTGLACFGSERSPSGHLLLSFRVDAGAAGAQ